MFPLTALLGIGSQLIKKLIPDPAAAAKAQLELAKMANDTKLYEVEQTAVTERWNTLTL